MKIVRIFVAVVGCCLYSQLDAEANVSLARIFGDGMVLQQGAKVPVWGNAAPGEKVTVKFNGQEVSAVAASNGTWRVALEPMVAGGPFPFTVEGWKKIEFKTVYVGDVWLCGGQSNMASGLGRASGKEAACGENTETLRYTHSGLYIWQAATNGNQKDWSAVGYFFGKALSDHRKCPIGLIQTAQGGSDAERWMPDRNKDKFKGLWGDLFEGGVRNYCLPFAIKGVIWYQGEANVSRSGQYADLMEGLISGWRKEWGLGDFPFLFVQLARFGPKRGAEPRPADSWALLRDAQVKTLRVTNTAMVVCFDVTDGGLHPANKKPVGERLALAARALAYGEKPACLSPFLDHFAEKDDKMILHFQNAEGGLVVKESPDGMVKDLYWLLPDKSTGQANAKIDGKTIVVEKSGGKPVGLYYGWSDFPVGNIYGANGLPVSPFRFEFPGDAELLRN